MIFLGEKNIAQLPLYAEADPDFGIDGTYIIFKRSYKIKENGHLDVCLIDELDDLTDEIFHSDEIGNSIKYPDDFLPPLGFVDFIVNANAYAENSEPVQEVICEIKSSVLEKKIRVIGDRTYTKYSDGDAELSAPIPFIEMPIRAELSFGGEDNPKNPFGRGHKYNQEKDPYLTEMFLAFEEFDTTEVEDTELLSEEIDPGNSFEDRVPVPLTSQADTLESNDETERNILYTVDAPNIEHFDRSFSDPFQDLEPEGFYCLPGGWSAELANDLTSKVFENIDVGSLDDDYNQKNLASEMKSDAYSNAFTDQRIIEIPPATIFNFVNMHQGIKNFAISFPDEIPRCFIACRDNELKLVEFYPMQNTVFFDLVSQKLTIAWKTKIKIEGQNALAKDFNAKYCFIFFEKRGEETQLDEIQKSFEAEAFPFEEVERLSAPVTEEELNQKFEEIKDTLVTLAKDFSVEPEFLEEIKSTQSSDELITAGEANLGELIERHKALIEELNAKYENIYK